MRFPMKVTITRLGIAIGLAFSLSVIAAFAVQYALLALGQPTPTPTPCFGCINPPETPLPVSPVPVAQTIDLAPNLALEDKARVFVLKTNGQYIELQVPPEWHLSQIPLSPGDVVVNVFPPTSSMKRLPPRGRTITPVPAQGQVTQPAIINLPPPPTPTQEVR